MAIWTLCLTITDGAVVEITDRATFVCNAPKNITPALLRVNQQIHEDAKTILFTKNVFGIRLHEGSCICKTRERNPQHAYGIPALWNWAFRQQVYHIRQWCIVVVLSYELEKEGLSPMETPYQLQQTKAEFKQIVSSAVEELCNVLALSSCLKSMHIRFQDQGRPSMKTMLEHNALRPFSRLKVLNEVEITGVPEDFAVALKTAMMKKQGEMLR